MPGDSMEDVVRRGRWSGTPFVVLGSVAAMIWLVVALVAGLALLVWWLAELGPVTEIVEERGK